MSARLALVVLAMLIGACGGGTEIPTLMVNDLCQFDGPTEVDEGEVRLTLQRTGLGDYGAALVQFWDGRGHGDLTTHFEEVSDDWAERPDWVEVTHLLETRDEDLTPEDHRGETTVLDLSPGEHTLVCINYSDSLAGVAGVIEVVPGT